MCVQVRGQPGHNMAFPSARQSVPINPSQENLIQRAFANPLAFSEDRERERKKASEWLVYKMLQVPQSLSVKKTWQREGEKQGQKERRRLSSEMPARNEQMVN